MATNIDLGKYEGIAWLVGETDDCTVAYAKGNLARLIASLGQSIYMVHKESAYRSKKSATCSTMPSKQRKNWMKKEKLHPNKFREGGENYAYIVFRFWKEDAL